MPEDVVQAQLDCLREKDLEQAYNKFISPLLKEATDNSWELFAEELIQEDFAPLVGHSQATVLMSVSGKDTYGATDPFTRSMCLVRLGCKKKKEVPKQYWWELSVDEDSGEWMVDGIVPDFESMELEEGIFLEDDDEDGIWIEFDDDDDGGDFDSFF